MAGGEKAEDMKRKMVTMEQEGLVWSEEGQGRSIERDNYY